MTLDFSAYKHYNNTVTNSLYSTFQGYLYGDTPFLLSLSKKINKGW